MSYQSITIVGNLGGDPEMRYLPNGDPVSSFSVAVSEKFNDKNGQPQEKTIWFRITCWRKLAEITSQYLTKGREVMVLGKLETPRTFTDKNTGEARAGLDVTAREVIFLSNGGKGAGGENGNSEAATAERVAQAVEKRIAEDDKDIPF